MNIRIFSRIYLAISLLALIIIIGMFGFMFLEDYSFPEAIYMTIITVSTVGFQEVQPLSDAGRLFTTFLIITSFGTFAYAVTAITTYIVGGEFKAYFKDYRVNKEVEQLKDHVIVCGYGRNGKQAIKKLTAHEQSFVVIETAKERVSQLRNAQKHLFVHGDATLDETLEKAGIKQAKALIAALPKDADNLFIVLSARQLNPDMTIISRASHDETYQKLKIAGADNVIMPDKVGGAHMASLVTTPDVVEFLDNISVEGSANINLEEISFDSLPADYQYKTIKDINARYHTGCTIIGFKTAEGEYVINPGADTELRPDSKLFVLGRPEQIHELNKLFKLV
jgi:voltage-gated potassium channel